MMAANPRLKPVAMAFLLSTMATGLCAGVDDNPVVQLVKYLFKPFSDKYNIIGLLVNELKDQRKDQ
jgi:hypothetical protein